MKQIRIYYFISLVPWFVFTNATPILHSLSELLCHPCSFSLCVLKIEPGRKSPTLNAVFTNSKRQILQVIYLNIGMLNALKFNERDAVLCILSTKNTSYSLIKKKKNYLSRSSPARDQSLSSSLRSESVSEALDCSELVPGNIKQEDRDGHKERPRHMQKCSCFVSHFLYILTQTTYNAKISGNKQDL